MLSHMLRETRTTPTRNSLNISRELSFKKGKYQNLLTQKSKKSIQTRSLLPLCCQRCCQNSLPLVLRFHVPVSSISRIVFGVVHDRWRLLDHFGYVGRIGVLGYWVLSGLEVKKILRERNMQPTIFFRLRISYHHLYECCSRLSTISKRTRKLFQVLCCL